MQIEIAEPGRMTQTGSSLLRLIQNNNMPILDLFIRESVQNSLDAGLRNKRSVEVQFLSGQFNSREFAGYLDSVSKRLTERYPDTNYDYLAIRDSNTAGLTGPLHYDDVYDNNYGNLLKLVYEISKPQEEEGAGGSWGLGKTVYFRVGIGLVVYYSRIMNRGKYESRLAVTMVENEKADNAIIPSETGKLRRGIAWWGEKIGPNKTQPVTDEMEIHKILSAFKISEYCGDETGTTVIIPYINKKELLHNNAVEYLDSDGNSIQPYWQNTIEDYLKISLQRWYAPRLNNPDYPYGLFLRVKVNGNPLRSADMEPEFKIIQSLYNRANDKINMTSDVLEENYSESTRKEDISLRNALNTTKSGSVAYTMVDRKILKMDYPDNKPAPYMYFNCEVRSRESNKPIVCFARKPGMIVSYEDVGRWADGIPETDPDHYIFAVFVLNSVNYLKNMPQYSLEEYARKSEMADHTSWSDFNIGSFNPRIISKTQGQIAKKISSEFGAKEETPQIHMNSGLGKLFGDMLLPPESYGKSAGLTPGKSGGEKKHVEKHRFVTLQVDTAKTEYKQNHMILHMTLTSNKGTENFGITLGIDSETGNIRVHDWEMQMGLTMPFEIDDVLIRFHKPKKADYEGYDAKLNRESKASNQKPFEVELLYSDKGKGYSVQFKTVSKEPLFAEITMSVCLFRRDLKPVIMLEEEGK